MDPKTQHGAGAQDRGVTYILILPINAGQGIAYEPFAAVLVKETPALFKLRKTSAESTAKRTVHQVRKRDCRYRTFGSFKAMADHLAAWSGATRLWQMQSAERAAEIARRAYRKSAEEHCAAFFDIPETGT